MDSQESRPEPILEYLRFVAKAANNDRGWLYGSYEELLLENGRSFEPIAVPDGIRTGDLGQCFANALQASIIHREYRYCEGYAIYGKLAIPMQHAWLVNENDEAVDVTWDCEDGVYFGVTFDTEWALDFGIETGYYGVLGNDWKHNYSLLKDGLPRKEGT